MTRNHVLDLGTSEIETHWKKNSGYYSILFIYFSFFVIFFEVTRGFSMPSERDGNMEWQRVAANGHGSEHRGTTSTDIGTIGSLMSYY